MGWRQDNRSKKTYRSTLKIFAHPEKHQGFSPGFKDLVILHKNFDSNHIFVISCIGANEFGQFGLVELERTLRNMCRLFTHFVIDLLAREP